MRAKLRDANPPHPRGVDHQSSIVEEDASQKHISFGFQTHKKREREKEKIKRANKDRNNIRDDDEEESVKEEHLALNSF